jgi:hypothetical protein
MNPATSSHGSTQGAFLAQHARVRTGRWLAALSGGALLVAAFGCGPDQGEEFLTVAGKVTLEGKALAVGTVSFRPDASRGNTSMHVPTSTIDGEGNYELVTVKKKGAPRGWYKVVVFADANSLNPKTGAHPLPPRWLTNVKYTDPTATDLAIEVVEKPAAGVYDLKLSK